MNTALSAPTKIAQIEFTSPWHLVMGLQSFQLGSKTLRGTAWRHLNEDRDLVDWSFNEAKVEGNLRTEKRTISFKGVIKDGRTITISDGRHYPWADIVDLEIIEDREELNDFSHDNEKVAFIEKHFIKYRPSAGR